jgi:NAD-dependent deacetylase
MQKIVVLTGAGVSAESGLKTFRDTDGLWEGHRVEDVATPEAWNRDPARVLDFYNQRRAQLKQAIPNLAHTTLAKLDEQFHTVIITQNVDDLHERGGSKNIIHLHGELFKVRSTVKPSIIYEWREDLTLQDKCEFGSQLRPHIVWFGEEVPMLEKAAQESLDAHICIIVGTSMQVYPAAGLIRYLPRDCKLYYIDPNPTISYELGSRKNLELIRMKATDGVQILVSKLMGKDDIH